MARPRWLVRSLPRLQIRRLNTETADIFTIPEEPIAIERADAQAAQEQARRQRALASEQDASVAEDATERLMRKMRSNMLKDFVGMASTQTRDTTFRPFKQRTQPIEPHQLTLSHLLAATAQLGHTRTHVQRSYEPYLYGTRHGMAVIDVERATLPALRRAVQVVRGIAEQDGIILIVGTRPDLHATVRAAAARLGKNGFHVSTDRWVPGVLTNASKLLAPAIQLSAPQNPESGDGSEVPNTAKLASQLYQPDLMIVLNPLENINALREATQCNIPTMAIVDTDVDPRSVTYAIPANDDSPRVAELILGVLSKAGQEGLRSLHEQRKSFEKREQSRKRRAQRQ
ncbi:hypothetical protein MPSI1_002932 [Malassezia psittaci]|uniref:Ribosomal protein S2 n=1 Tax=Malassezia psittaci TaxID=1821823 RepID=A0AAF0JLL3_9BASI|nr:hypothetical protein MPSI1_002932 [Malassezia psittaci]